MLALPYEAAKAAGAVCMLAFVVGLLVAWGAERGERRTRATEVAYYAQKAQALYQENTLLADQLSQQQTEDARSKEVRELQEQVADLTARLDRPKKRRHWL